MSDVLQTLLDRGFIQQCTDPEALSRLLAQERVVFYCGFDATATSLHCGSLMPIMAMAHLQRAGHFPIALIGGGTTMVGDPSGKTEMRKMLTPEEIERNGRGILSQLQRFLQLDGERGLFLNNADWLLPLNYIQFLRDVGRHFRVNEMLKSEAYRLRMEREDGLSFIEFNYQILQAYDFMVLARDRDCRLQIGGDDQWGNIVAGVDLTRRMLGKQVFGMTFPLLTTARGEKMGKTNRGAIWLDAERTPPYEFYQYWINTDDRDVERFLAFFTFLPMEEVRRLGRLEGADIRIAKETLAYEVTKLTHGQEEADRAREASRAAFGGGGEDLSAMPATPVPVSRLQEGIPIIDLLCETGLAKSRSDARRLVLQGGAYVNDEQVPGLEATVGTADVRDGAVLLRAGKKKYHRVVAQD